MASVPQRGDFVRVRSRRWLVEDERPIDGLKTLRLACVDDDAQGELAEVLWDAEIDGSVLGDESWASVANLGTDDPSVFSAYFRTLRWNTATAADRDLFQAPFRNVQGSTGRCRAQSRHRPDAGCRTFLDCDPDCYRVQSRHSRQDCKAAPGCFVKSRTAHI